tara:strand:- start:136 stop:363 length:228 start_codon:yes stop_codon:yes gene_type:complete
MSSPTKPKAWQLNFRMKDDWYTEKIIQLCQRTGMKRTELARDLLEAAIRQCFPNETPENAPRENLMNIYNQSNQS